jgi:hypothetical protein
MIDGSGVLQQDLREEDIRCGGNIPIYDLEIKSGTRALDNDGSPLQSISIQPSTGQLAPPAGETIIWAVEFGPAGATFSEPMVITLQYDAAQLPQGINAASLALVYYDSLQNAWVHCDYTLDTHNHRITGDISHFSTYAIIGKNGGGVIGLGWSMAGIVITLEFALGVVIYFLLRRRRRLVPAPAGTGPTLSKATPVYPDELRESGRAAWEDRLPGDIERTEAPTAQTEFVVVGGKIVIPRDDKSSDIEIMYAPESRAVISTEYDHTNSHLRGTITIIVVGKASEPEKSKEE